MACLGEQGSNPWLLRELAGDHGQKTHINPLELLAILAVIWSVGRELLEDRDVIFFCDNTSAMSAAVRCYARSSHMALSNTLHLALASLRCNAWFEWVPSEANCADIPSRPQGPEEQQFYDDLQLERWHGGGAGAKGAQNFSRGARKSDSTAARGANFRRVPVW